MNADRKAVTKNIAVISITTGLRSLKFYRGFKQAFNVILCCIALRNSASKPQED